MQMFERALLRRDLSLPKPGVAPMLIGRPEGRKLGIQDVLMRIRRWQTQGIAAYCMARSCACGRCALHDEDMCAGGMASHNYSELEEYGRGQ